MRTDCKEVRAILSQDAAGGEVADHLGHCVACRLNAAAFVRLDQLLLDEARLEQPIVPSSVMASIRVEVEARRDRAARWSRVWSPSLVAAAVVVVAGLLSLADVAGWLAPIEEAAAAVGLAALPESTGLFDLEVSGVVGALGHVPVPSLALLLLGVAAVAGFNWTLCRTMLVRGRL